MEGCHLEDRKFEGKLLDRDMSRFIQRIFIEHLLQIGTGLDTGVTLLHEEKPACDSSLQKVFPI